jgi:hypothetical protein
MSVTPPTDDDLAGARRFVQRGGVSIPIDAEWFALADGWEASLLAATKLATAGGDWVEVTG